MNTGEPDLFQVCLRARLSSPQSRGEWTPVLIEGEGVESIFDRIRKFDIMESNSIFFSDYQHSRSGIAVMGV